MSLSSYLTCNLVARQRQRPRPPYDYDGPQPQTATCCTALQRGVTGDGHGLLAHPRYAPLRTPGSAAALLDPPAVPTTESGSGDGNGNDEKKKAQRVRKCKSTVEEVDVSQLIVGGRPRLRRSGGVRRDWSFEDLRANNAAA